MHFPKFIVSNEKEESISIQRVKQFQIVTASDDNTMRIWRFDPTVALRKASGKSDGAYGITGTAERTHRDIGTGMLLLASFKK